MSKGYEACRECDFRNSRHCDVCTSTDRVKILRAQDSSNDDTFMESMFIGALTNSTVAGALLGGDIFGAALGDMLGGDDDGWF